MAVTKAGLSYADLLTAKTAPDSCLDTDAP